MELTEGDAFLERPLGGWHIYVGESFPRIAVVRSNTGETSGSRSLQRKKDALMAPHARENSRGGRSSREKYAGETSPTKIGIPA